MITNKNLSYYDNLLLIYESWLFSIAPTDSITTMNKGMVMKKHIFLSIVLLVIATPSLAKGIFLEDLINTEYNITEDNSWKNSPYAIEETPELNAFTGDRCSAETKKHLNTYPDSSRNRNVECYITHFPNSDVKTHIQSSDNGDVSVGFSWGFN